MHTQERAAGQYLQEPNNNYTDFHRARKECNQCEETSDSSSWMMDHIREVHSDKISTIQPEIDFQFSVLSTHRDPLTRLTTEAVRIQQALEVGTVTRGTKDISIVSMNRKGEYFAARERWVSRQGHKDKKD